MQPGGGNMNAAQLARLQQQLAQYGRGNGQQNMMNNMGNMGGQNPQLQQVFMQQQLQQHQGNQGGMVRRNSSIGMNGNSAAALAMMQQQQGGSNMANTGMPSYWNALQAQNSGGAMDASSASSAHLAALAGMNMNMNTSNPSQNSPANMLLGNRSNQSHNQGMVNPQMQGMGQNMGQNADANLLQQQILQLQRQLQQQQQSQNQGIGMQGLSGMDRRSSGANFIMQGGPQLFQQMQQMNGMLDTGMGMGNNPSMNNNMLSTQNMQSHSIRGVSNSQGMISNSVGGLSERELLLQQQQLLRSSNMSSSMQNDASRVQDLFSNQNQDLIGQRRSTQGNHVVGNFNNNMNAYDMDGSVSSQRSNSVNAVSVNKTDDEGNQKSFLDGSFAGGWQSNADLPDRRRIIFSILEVIRQMRPDTNKISQKYVSSATVDHPVVRYIASNTFLSSQTSTYGKKSRRAPIPLGSNQGGIPRSLNSEETIAANRTRP